MNFSDLSKSLEGPLELRLRSLSGSIEDGRAFAGQVPVSKRESIWIELRDSNGVTGVGEATPLAGFHPERVADAMAALELVATRLRIGRRSEEELSTLPASARFAWETALSDLIGKRRGVSVASLLRGAPVTGQVRVSAFAGSLKDGESVARAHEAARSGHPAVKMKASGSDLEAERRMLELLRRELPPEISLRLDLNGALGREQAQRALAAYSEAGVELVEEPTSGADLLALEPGGVPWFADESLVDRSLWGALLDHPGCGGVVLKPSLLGLGEAHALGNQAHRRGKQVIVTHMFDGPIALAACIELALSFETPPLASGIGFHAGLAAFPRLKTERLAEPRATMTSSRLPGLGVELADG